MTEQHGGNPADDRPGPYRGVFGSPESSPPPDLQSPTPTPYGDRPGAYGAQRNPQGDRPGAYGGVFGAGSGPYAAQVGPPRQVTVAAVISIGLGAMCVLLAGLAFTPAGEQIAEIVTGSKDARSMVIAVILASAAAYILPAVFLLKRRAWARYVLIAVAAIGIAGGAMALPAGILGLAIHTTLFVLMLHNATKLWFRHR